MNVKKSVKRMMEQDTETKKLHKKTEDFNASVDEIASLLERRHMTPREVADEFGCARGTAYERIAALDERLAGTGRVLATGTLKQDFGPPAMVYGVVRARGE